MSASDDEASSSDEARTSVLSRLMGQLRVAPRGPARLLRTHAQPRSLAGLAHLLQHAHARRIVVLV